MLPSSLGTMPLVMGAFATVTAIKAPQPPLLSSDPGVVLVVDVLRILLLIAGLCLAGITLRHTIVVPHQHAAAAFVPGFRWRSVALCIGLLYVSFAAYSRLGQPVGIQFVLALLFVASTARSVHLASVLPAPAPEGVTALEQYVVPSKESDQTP